MLRGVIFDKNQEALVHHLQANMGRLGMSFEVSDAEPVDASAKVWTLKTWEPTGASVLDKRAAAYHDSAFTLEGHAHALV